MQHEKPIHLTDEDGQAMIEFIFSFAFGLGIVMLFVTMTFNLTRGYLNHYATFMASRVFLTVQTTDPNGIEGSLNEAERLARQTFSSYELNKFDIDSDVVVYSPTKNAVSAMLTGVTARFEKKMTIFGLIGGDTKATYLSESFLGKEPVTYQCYQSICQALGLNCQGGLVDATLFDNGC